MDFERNDVQLTNSGSKIEFVDESPLQLRKIIGNELTLGRQNISRSGRSIRPLRFLKVLTWILF